MSTAPKLASIAPARTSAIFEQHFSPEQLAKMWSLSADTIRRMFEREPGVLVFENPDKCSSRRRRTLRIPESVASRVHAKLSRGVY